MPNTPILKTIYGAHLFGLDTPDSDRDYKGIFQASIEDIILRKDVKTINESTTSNAAKNSSNDIDLEFKELRTFINDCLAGQTYALEMLFTPAEFILESSPTWDFIVANRSKLVPNDLQPFIGYAFSQSQKYSLRGKRLEELERVIAWFQTQNSNDKLGTIVDKLEMSDYTFTQIYKHKLKLQTHPNEERLCSLGMIFQYNKPIKECLPTLLKRLDQYGTRSEIAKDAGGTDWKSYSHAFRLMYEWEQLLTQGRLSFPIPRSEFVKGVKLGHFPIEEMQDKLFDEFARINALPNNLPMPDREFWDRWLVDTYLNPKHF
jgi:RNA repair pathway DNA polymerase beta family